MLLASSEVGGVEVACPELVEGVEVAELSELSESGATTFTVRVIVPVSPLWSVALYVIVNVPGCDVSI